MEQRKNDITELLNQNIVYTVSMFIILAIVLWGFLLPQSFETFCKSSVQQPDDVFWLGLYAVHEHFRPLLHLYRLQPFLQSSPGGFTHSVSLRFSVTLRPFQFRLYVVHPSFDVAPVGLQFLLSRSPRAYASPGSGKRLAEACESGHSVFQLRQFNLQFPLGGVSSFRKYIEYQDRSVNHFHVQGVFKISQLVRQTDTPSMPLHKRIHFGKQ